jgi:hypothetical protein
VGYNLTQWHRMVGRVAHVTLSEVQDEFVWDLLQNGSFTVNLMYNALTTDTWVVRNLLL